MIYNKKLNETLKTIANENKRGRTNRPYQTRDLYYLVYILKSTQHIQLHGAQPTQPRYVQKDNTKSKYFPLRIICNEFTHFESLRGITFPSQIVVVVDDFCSSFYLGARHVLYFNYTCYWVSYDTFSKIPKIVALA